MRYWDSSAILPLLLKEEATKLRRGQLEADPQVMTWWASRVECASALNRLLREGVLSGDAFERLLDELGTLSASWLEIQPTHRLRQRALRLLRLHPLGAADAFQLAAAVIGSGEEPPTLPFLCGDPGLNEAARKEGFPLLR
jgi:predicted nucleic acid-binding protein